MEGGERNNYEMSKTGMAKSARNLHMLDNPTKSFITGDRIDPSRAVTNTSKSKMAYSFGKGSKDRFAVYKPRADKMNHQTQYDLPSTLKTQDITFGCGNRLCIHTKKEVSPDDYIQHLVMLQQDYKGLVRL